MKFEIELKDFKAKKKKQRYILDRFLAEAKRLYGQNRLKSFLQEVEKYNNYVASLQGTRKGEVEIPYLKSQGTDRLNNGGQKYMKMYRELFKVRNDHRPKNVDLGKWIGVEIECFIPYEEYDDDTNTGFSNESNFREYVIEQIQNRKIKYVSVKYDGSISGSGDNCTEVEFTILTKIDDLSNLEKLCQLLRDLGAEVNASCGLHIHLDQRDAMRSERKVELRRRLSRLNQALPLLTSIVPPSRRSSTYCSTNRSKLRNGTRYMAINTEAVHRFGTFEIRLHSGTTDFTKISNWIKLCYAISRCEKIKNSEKHVIRTMEQLKEKYLTDMPQDMFDYFKGRIDKFVVQAGPVNNAPINTVTGQAAQSISQANELEDYALENGEEITDEDETFDDDFELVPF